MSHTEKERDLGVGISVIFEKLQRGGSRDACIREVEEKECCLGSTTGFLVGGGGGGLNEYDHADSLGA